MHIFLVAGEASADRYGGMVAQALRERCRDVHLTGLGGQQMQTAGVELLRPLAEHGVVGLVEALSVLPFFVRVMRESVAFLRRERPDVVVLIDCPAFNLRLAKRIRSLGIPIVYYVSPQIWAWRPKRVHDIRRLVDQMLVILPFEEAIYREAGIPVTYVGHPLLEILPRPEEHPPRPSAIPRRIGIMPGSRKAEIRRILPVLAEAAECMREQDAGVEFTVILAETLSEDVARPMLGGLDIPIVRDPDYRVRLGLDLVLAASGTATLENTILGLPMVIVYRANELTFRAAKRVIRVKYIGLVNLLAGREVCPELIQHSATPQAIAAEALAMLGDPGRLAEIRADLDSVVAGLGGPGASGSVADAIIASTGQSRPDGAP